MSLDIYEKTNTSHPHTVRQPTKYDRYSDVTPYEETRVHLSSCPEADYINASFLKYKSCTFIACQSPIPTTVHHFWQMVVEQRINLIVMLVTVEKRKCEQYWPEPGMDITPDYKFASKISKDGSDGTFNVKGGMQKQEGPFMHRSFEIVTEKESWTCEHWQYLEWPDHDAPSTTTDILTFIRSKMGEKDLNILVHCSGGCGRTGTFCTIWTALCEGITDLRELAQVIATFKHQRNLHWTVETKPQYDFILRALDVAMD